MSESLKPFEECIEDLSGAMIHVDPVPPIEPPMPGNTEVAVTFGQFNLLHKGHVQLFDRLLKEGKEAVIGISNHPQNLPLKSREEAIISAVNNNGQFYIRQGYHPMEIFEWVRNTWPSDTSVTLVMGENQYALAQQACKIFSFKQILIPRLTSSEVVRCVVDNQEWDLLPQLVPTNLITKVISLRQLELSRLNKNQGNNSSD